AGPTYEFLSEPWSAREVPYRSGSPSPQRGPSLFKPHPDGDLMRARFPFPFAALVIAFLAIAQAPPAHAVLVQGFEVTALGSADVAAVVTANSPPRRLVNSNI